MFYGKDGQQKIYDNANAWLTWFDTRRSMRSRSLGAIQPPWEIGAEVDACRHRCVWDILQALTKSMPNYKLLQKTMHSGLFVCLFVNTRPAKDADVFSDYWHNFYKFQ
jgi:hypothetical protein